MEEPNYTLFGMADGGQDSQAMMTYKGGVVLPELTVTPQGNYIYNPYDNINIFDDGGGIHIKPSHKGRLTELKERTSKTEAELYDDGNPAHRKMVVFARNARKWKHGDGGNLFDPGGYLNQTEENTQPVMVDMTNVGLGAEGNPHYYIDNTMNPLDEVVVTAKAGQNPYGYRSAFDGSLSGNMEVLNAMTGGVMNRLSPTQDIRLIYDAATGNDWRKSWMGNNGVVFNDEWAQEHPFATMLINGAGDVAAGGMLYGAKNINQVGRRALETGMRTTSAPIPFEAMWNGAKHIMRNDPKRFGNIGTYVLTGRRFGNKGYYNSLAPDYKDYYTGFLGDESAIHAIKGNDMIDAYLYGDKIDPAFGYNQVWGDARTNYFDDYIN